MNSLIIIFTSIVGATLTYWVSKRYNHSLVRASALLSLIVGLFFYFFPDILNPYLTENIPIAFFGASFIGMVSSEVATKYGLLTIAGILFSVIYINESFFFNGYGGALGTSAFIALLATIGIQSVFQKVKR